MSVSQDNYISRQIISFFRRNTGANDGYNETLNIGATGPYCDEKDENKFYAGMMDPLTIQLKRIADVIEYKYPTDIAENKYAYCKYTGPTGKNGDVCLIGNTGPTGRDGEMGLMGDTGPRGRDGEMGLMGDTGPRGRDGEMGLMGDTGPRGRDGEMGLMGDTGPRGRDGEMGLMGDTGPTGKQGEMGLMGDTGPRGRDGEMGLMGDTGPSGRDGQMGLIGPTGPAGINGRSGSAGPIGKIGPTGATGASPWLLRDNNSYFTSGNVGIGTSDPSALLTLSSDKSGIILLNGGEEKSRPIEAGIVSNEIMGLSSMDSNKGQLRLSAGGATHAIEKTYIDMYGYDQRYIAFGTVGTEQMRIDSNGFIGIGIKQPKCRLHLASSSSTIYAESYASMSSEEFVASSDVLDFQNTTVYTEGSIVCNGRIASVVFHSFSDKRIKKNVLPFNRDAIDIVNRLEIVSYDHIDSKKKSIGAGVIAQEVEQVFPECITKNNEIVPNIYAMCRHIENLENIDIFVDIFVEGNDDILSAKRVSLKIGRRRENCEIDIVSDIISVVFDKGYIITVSKWKNYMNTDELFVYGTDVSDFRMVDKEMISMVSVKAIQQLSRENQELKTRLLLQEKRIARLEELFKNL